VVAAEPRATGRRNDHAKPLGVIDATRRPAARLPGRHRR
jgi:hypothetical protein